MSLELRATNQPGGSQRGLHQCQNVQKKLRDPFDPKKD